MTFSTGIALSVARIQEPFFRYMVLKTIYQFWGEIYDENKDGSNSETERLNNDALSTFLSSSLNVELVYIVLMSITTFAKGQSANDDIKITDAKGNITQEIITAINVSERDTKKLDK